MRAVSGNHGPTCIHCLACGGHSAWESKRASSAPVLFDARTNLSLSLKTPLWRLTKACKGLPIGSCKSQAI
eukprot:363076-Chlamydomonas_euryale.AAC.4